MGSYSKPISTEPPKVYTQEAIDKALLEVWEKIAQMEQNKLVKAQPELIDEIHSIQDELTEIKNRVNQPTLVEYIKFWKR
mgnify:CR=1 FL=1